MVQKNVASQRVPCCSLSGLTPLRDQRTEVFHKMPKHSAKQPKQPPLGPFELGQIKAHMFHELGPQDISDIVARVDGTPINRQTVANAMEKLRTDPAYQGLRKTGSGRKRKTSATLDKQLVKTVNPLGKSLA